MTGLHRIDVHHHFVPPFWAQALPDHGGDSSGWKTPAWSPEADLAFMERASIDKAILSLTSPGVAGWVGSAQADMARRVNEHAADIAVRYPGRFGSFATIPTHNTDAALREIAYALDVLSADGVVLFSNYDGTYLGDSRFEPVWRALDERQAVVFVHPTMPPVPLIDGIPGPILDFPYDTTRTALSLLMSGVTTRYRRVKIILSHGGGMLPYCAYRMSGAIAGMHPERSPGSVIAEMKRFYFDIALTASPSSLPSLLEFAEPDHILFGSDFPYANSAAIAWFNNCFDRYGAVYATQRHAINRGNALALLDLEASSDTVGASEACG